MKYNLILLTFLFFSSLFGQSLKLDTSFTSDYLVDKILVGKGIRVGNVSLSGRKQSICYFAMDTNVIGMKSGLMLSTGNVFDIAQENTSPGTSGIAWNAAGKSKYRSDKDLNKLCKGKTCDQIILEFDFVPFNNNISFNFSFASEEFTEYVGSNYNDVFGFIVTGANIKKKNIAVIPNTSTPITINNINQKVHKELFINNDYFLNYGLVKVGSTIRNAGWFRRKWNHLFNKKNYKNGYYVLEGERKKLNPAIVSTFEYDGFTKVLKASCILEPWKLYHLKIAIGDVGDAIFDSGVFLEEGSFVSVRDTTVANFKDYQDLSNEMNWDSIFKIKKSLDNTVPKENLIIEEKFEITNVHFDTDKSDIPDSCLNQLDQLANFLNKHKTLKLSIQGFTDNKGSKKYNLQLSENRALAVMYYLTSKGVERSRMFYVGNSFENPVADNYDEKGRAKNRRVELSIVEEESEFEDF